MISNFSLRLFINRFINRLIRFSLIKNIPVNEKTIYLTFDDGPEPGITEFVLKVLKDYNFKGTFFCRGDNAEKYPVLMDAIRKAGHEIGNHTFSHCHAYKTRPNEYVKDVEHANHILGSRLFRPPHGSMTLLTWLHLKHKYRIIYWEVGSGDSNMSSFNLEYSFNYLKTHTKSGSIVLFHFCKKHENETREILPIYLDWLADNAYSSKEISF